MNAQISLLDEFIKALHKKFDKRSDLVQFITDTLKIGKDSASRRLNKKVYFNIDEMGILASELGISLDLFLSYRQGYPFSVPYVLTPPMNYSSIDILTRTVAKSLSYTGNMGENAELGNMFTFPPVEFLVPYKNLLKFAYFKWGHFNVRSDAFSDYSLWTVPKDLADLSATVLTNYRKYKKVLYIWDVASIWYMMKDIKYLQSVYALDDKNAELIKLDIHKMLYDIEKFAQGNKSDIFGAKEVEFYVSTGPVGCHFSYYMNGSHGCSIYRSFFVGSDNVSSYEMCTQIKEWMHSLKKACILISESGTRERKIFFNEQHAMVDTI
jgi:hypothetical protein